MASRETIAEVLPETTSSLARRGSQTIFTILAAISACHLLNDLIQATIPSLYPLFQHIFGLSLGQIGMITFTYQLTASLFQPFVGMATDKKPMPYSLALGMSFSLCGLVLMAWAPSYGWLLAAGSLVGLGSSVFHPESSRVARLASGGQHGLAQSLFQLGGNMGSALGPLLVLWLVLSARGAHAGQHRIAWFSVAALVAIAILLAIGGWYKAQVRAGASGNKKVEEERPHAQLPRGKMTRAMVVLMTLVFSKYFYLASITSYYTFYLIQRFRVTLHQSEMYLFIFLGAVALGTILGGPIGDRYGRRLVIWVSIVGVLPFTLLLPYANLEWTAILSFVIGTVLSSAFSAILVYAQELVPGRVGMISGLFFGLAFGMGGVGAALLGKLADMTSLNLVYHVCSYLPALGLLTGLLPKIEENLLPRAPKEVEA
ncbi:MAG TPA: MFS transporter [Acidobacteriaceae bacterium]|nr:MFS transporter [Acidobacteriaceae bacterium]